MGRGTHVGALGMLTVGFTAWCAGTSVALAAETKIAVMSLSGDELPPTLVSALTGVVTQTLGELGPFTAISVADIRQMLEVEQLKQSLGCETAVCLSEIGGALGARYLVTGALVRAGDTTVVQLRLMDTRHVQVTARVERAYTGDIASLFEEVRAATKLLMRDLLATRGGRLLVEVSEEEATIQLDGSVIGSSPMPATDASGGMHTLVVEKEGFVRFVKDIEIAPQTDTRVSLVLVPSFEYRTRYEAGARRTRLAAFGALGLGAAGLVTSGLLWRKAAADGEELNADIDAYAAQPTRDGAEAEALAARRRRIGALDAWTAVTGGVGLVAALTGTVLFLTGDEPGRFSTDAEPVVLADTGLGMRWRIGLAPHQLLFAGTY